MNRAQLESLTRQWRRHHALRHAGFGLAAGCLGAALLAPWSHAAAGAIGVLAGAIVAWILHRRTPTVSVHAIVAHLNRVEPQLEESAGLWLRSADDLSLVERLQLQRLQAAGIDSSVLAQAEPPRRGRHAAAATLAFSGVVLIGILLVTSDPGGRSAADSRQANSLDSTSPLSVHGSMEIRPPAYLGRSPRHVDAFSADVEEGSTVIWRFSTSSNVGSLELTGTGPHSALSAQALGEGRFEAQEVVRDHRVYQITVLPVGGSPKVLPALHALRVLRDQPPRLTWRLPSLSRTSLAPSNPLPVLPIELLADDDHGMAEVRLVLTVAKGSGEGMRFREQTTVLKGATVPGASHLLYAHTLDLNALGLEPGDELYGHAIGTDNRSPTPNESRTDTRWVTLQGPEAQASDPAVVLSGVKRLPQYFRSQRQLILDTEQLLAERPTLTEAQFRARSENIGIDQKLLRLRYGQFLGEEFEPDAAGAPKEAQAMEWAASIRSPAAADAQQSAAIGRAIEATHAHLPEPNPTGRPLTAQQILAPLTHHHDSAEAATLFDETIKAALRAVLAAMWDAEGFLRTARPEAALPAENRALETLKALQQADRLSVARVSFEPPPIKVEERRLRGELEPIPAVAPGTPSIHRIDADADALRQAIATLGHETPLALSEDLAVKVEERLLRAAQSEPERFLNALQLWRSRRNLPRPLPLEIWRTALWSLVPTTEESPRRVPATNPELASRYLEALSRPTSQQP